MKSYFNGLNFNIASYVKKNKIIFPKKLNLIEHKLCMNNQVSNIDSGEPLVYINSSELSV
jgi:hypothetical protein